MTGQPDGLARALTPVRLGVAVGVVLGSVYAIAWAVFGTPLAFWRPSDDAYYYFDTVRSLHAGLGISTDGIHTTSGFHPLWFLVLLPFGATFDQPDNGLVVVSQLLGIALLGVSVGLVAAAARRLALGALAAAIGAGSLALAPWRGVASAGVEGALALACLSLSVWSVVRLLEEPDDRRLQVLAGVAAGAAVLARLDAVIVVGVLLVTALWATRRSPQGASRTAAVLGVPAALVAAYLLANLVRTGQAMPVTASLKSTFPRPHLRASFVTSYAEYYLAIAVAWVGVACARSSRQRLVLTGLAVGATTFGLYLAMFGRGVFWWHFVSVLPAGALGVAVVVDAILSAARRAGLARHAAAAVGGAALAVLLVPLVTSLLERTPEGRYHANNGWRVEAERAGRWAGAHLPRRSLLAMHDSGAFGFYTVQPVMNLDGVISDRAFNDALCAGTAVDEMNSAGVRYVAHHAVEGSYSRFELRLRCWEEDTAPSRLEFSPTTRCTGVPRTTTAARGGTS